MRVETAARARAALTAHLRGRGYDGIIMANDAGSAGRATQTVIALDPTQVKGTNNSGAWSKQKAGLTAGILGGVGLGSASTRNRERAP